VIVFDHVWRYGVIPVMGSVGFVVLVSQVRKLWREIRADAARFR